jgi:protein involved in polysaccharide export with SLBB domain
MPFRRIWACVALLAACLLSCALLFKFDPAEAQTLPSSTTIQSVLSGIGATPPGPTQVAPAVPTSVGPNVMPLSQTFTPATATFPPPSRLELLYSQRAGQPLQQFGYDTFGVGTSVTVTQVGNVQDSYILGPGDQISVVLRGHDMSSYVVPIDRDGRLIIPNYQPVMAAGRTFGQVRADLAEEVARDALSTRAYISLAGSRQISVIVTGEVYAPGLRTLSGLNSPLDAILLSGGVRKTGSLRNIILERGGVRHRIDLYTVIGHGNAASLGPLTEGDHIIVPAIGPTAAVIGLVKRAGIYELPAGSSAIDAVALVRLAGGYEIGGTMRVSKIGLQASGRTELVALGRDGIVRNGEILSADQVEAAAMGRVTLVGAVQLPGTRALNDVPSLSRLFSDAGELTSDAYTQFGIIVHRDPRSNFRKPEAFSLKRVFEGVEDKKLGSNDIVYVFTTAQVQSLAAAAYAQVQNMAQYSNVPPSGLNTTAQTLSALNLSMPSQAGYIDQRIFRCTRSAVVNDIHFRRSACRPAAGAHGSAVGADGRVGPVPNPNREQRAGAALDSAISNCRHRNAAAIDHHVQRYCAGHERGWSCCTTFGAPAVADSTGVIGHGSPASGGGQRLAQRDESNPAGSKHDVAGPIL